MYDFAHVLKVFTKHIFCNIVKLCKYKYILNYDDISKNHNNMYFVNIIY